MTRRQDIIKLLSQQSMTLRELCDWFHVNSKDILEDLDKIKWAVKPGKLAMEPSSCRGCAFVFKDRDKLRRPSKCPKCSNEKITEPVFSIEWPR